MLVTVFYYPLVLGLTLRMRKTSPSEMLSSRITPWHCSAKYVGVEMTTHYTRFVDKNQE